METVFRSPGEGETGLLKDFLYEAIFIPEGVEAPDRSITNLPELALYYEDFGQGRADHCIFAEAGGKVVGAVWSRIMQDYGHVDDNTPSLAISLYKEYRGKGIGTELLRRMLVLLRDKGYRQVSLAVQKANYAVKMYKKAGFQTVDENDQEYIMVCRLQEPVPEVPRGGGRNMYLKSRQLSERIKAVTEEADRLTDHVCAFEEFIALPFFGQIILRFNLNKDEFTAKEVWRFESILRMAAGEEFLTDFMGSVYRKAGLDFSLLEIRLRELESQLGDENVSPSLHAEGIRSDGAFLLRAAGLDPELPVWEIQPEGDGFYLLVLGKEPKQIKAVEEPFRISVSEVEERACTGLIKAALYAGRNNVSLLWLLKDGTAWK